MANVHVAQLGARLHYAIPICLQRRGHLATLFTDFSLSADSLAAHVVERIGSNHLPVVARRALGRVVRGVPGSQLRTFPGLAVYAWNARRRAATSHEQALIGERIMRAFARKVMRTGRVQDGDVLWTFNEQSKALREQFKDVGLFRVMDQCVAERRTVREAMQSECDHWPEWGDAEKMLVRANDPFEEKQACDWDESDIITAPSVFVKDSLLRQGVDAAKIRLVPYAVDVSRYRPRQRDYAGDRSLRVLFVGEVGLRKGAPYLLAAAERLRGENVQVRLVGRSTISELALSKYGRYADIVGAIPRVAMMAEYEWADVLVLPSLVEGSAQVLYEALASGIPVVCTPNAGAPIEHMKQGTLIAARSSDAIVAALTDYRDNPELLARHSLAAIMLRDYLDFSRYESDLNKVASLA